MNIKSIKTETDYNEVLKVIDSLFCAKPNTPNGDKLDMLVTLVEAYEAELEREADNTVSLSDSETEYLLSIPGMRESIIEGLNTDIDDCDEAVQWDKEFLK